MTSAAPKHTAGVGDVRTNPYAGPRALRQGEPIYGRVREINELRGLILSERIVLLFSPSGAGKTSLIEAGLRPEFERRRFQVMPTIRVGYETPGETPDANRYRLSVLASLESARPAGEQLSPEDLASIGLADYFRTILAADPDLDLFVVFDQFEEIFTLDPTDWETKEAFLSELGTAMANRSIFALFSMREDFIAQLDPYQSSMPTRFSNTYRLGLLGPSEAELAIQKPAEEAGVEFADDAARGLVDDLRRVRVDRGATSSLELGPSVEPVQLQVVCSQLWEHLDPAATVIRAENVDDIGNVNEALAGYYASEVAGVAGRTHVKERSIRDWFVEQLISDDGFRTQTREGPGHKSENVLSQLEDAHLIRADRRRGTQWYELTHDRFVDPIRTSNLEFHRNRRAKLLKIAIPIAALVLMAVTSLVVDLLASPQTESSEPPAKPISGTSSDDVFVVDASQVMRYRFDDGEVDDEITLVVTAEATDPMLGIQPAVDVRLLQVGTGETGDDLEAGATRSIPPNGSTVEQSYVAGTADAESSGTTTSTAKASQETIRPVERTYSLPADGSYFIEISATSGASITFGYQRVAGAAAPGLTTGEPVQGRLDVAGAVSRFEFTVDDNGTVELLLEPSDRLDGVLVLLGDDGQPIDSVDATGPNQRESLVRTFEDGGTYTVNVAGFEGSIGMFSLTLERLDVVQLTSGEGAVDVASPSGRATAFSFSAESGDVVSVVVVPSAGSTATLEVSGASGRQYGFAEFEGAPITTAQVWSGGGGLIVIRDDSGAPGEFSLLFEQLIGTPIVLDVPAEGQSAQAEPIYYTFEGVSGEVYSVSTSANVAATSIFPPGDIPIVSETFVAPFDGGYVVVVQPESSETITTAVTRAVVDEIGFGDTRSGTVADANQSVAYLFSAELGDTYAVTLTTDSVLPPFMLLVTAPDGFPETIELGWVRVSDLPAGLSCEALITEGLSFPDAVLYTSLDAKDAFACVDSYPSQDVSEFSSPDFRFQMFSNSVAPFDGQYLITFVPGDVGPYEISLDR